MFLVHKKGLTLDGQNPTLLSGYGGFNISLTPAFSTRAVLWIEQGGVYAVANLRGGGEFGEKWHESGMLGSKQNVFDDFLSAARWLIDNRYTRPENLAITGQRSNGGLLVRRRQLTQAPELFQAVICGYPLLDMIRYHKFLVAKFWVPEYGSSEDADQFATLLAYSPYHRVKQGTTYPAVLFLTGDADTRVDPLHARKMTALMQASTASDRPVLLKYDTKLGHTGARPISQSIDDLTDEFCFLFEQLGVTFKDAGDVVKSASSGESSAQTAAAADSGDAATLQRLFDEEWEWGLREDPMFASHLGDPRYNDRWPEVSLKADLSIGSATAHRQDVLTKLDAIDTRLLSADDRLNYRLFRRQYEMDVEEFPFHWHLIPVNPRDGIQDAGSLGDVLRFATVKDYDDWLARIERFPVYIGQTIELMRAGIKEKMLLPKIVMERVPAQIRRQIVDDPEKTLFFKPFRNFPDEIPAGDRQRLTADAAQTGDRRQGRPRLPQVRRVLRERLPAGMSRPGRRMEIAARERTVRISRPPVHDDQSHSGRDPRDRPGRGPADPWRNGRDCETGRVSRNIQAISSNSFAPIRSSISRTPTNCWRRIRCSARKSTRSFPSCFANCRGFPTASNQFPSTWPPTRRRPTTGSPQPTARVPERTS